MAKHEVSIHENTGATRGAAPYLGSYVSKETIHLPDFTAFLALKCGLPAIQVETILSASFEAIEELEAEALTRIHLDGFTICGVITGSFPTSDAAFDPERNSLELALRLDDAIRLVLSDVVPYILADDIGTRLRVDNVMDLAEERPMNLIHGQHVFRVAGYNMVLSDEGATAYLQDSLGATYPLVVDEVVSKQLFKAHTSALLEGGDYKLVVKSRAGVADGPLQTSFRRVKYLKVADPAPTHPPTITRVTSPMGDGKVTIGERFEIYGENLEGATVQFFLNDSETPFATPAVTLVDGHLEGDLGSAAEGAGKVVVTNGDGSAEQAVEFLYH